MDAKRYTVLLGLVFLVFLALSYIENAIFFNMLSEILRNQLLAIGMIFIHNVLVISLILLGMTFYVNLVLNFLEKEKTRYGEHIVLAHPRVFAIAFTLIIVFLSILRGCTLTPGPVSIEALPLILLISTPIGIVEGYGIYLTIKKTLSREMTLKSLAFIYALFLIAAVMEVGFINLLIQFST